MDEIIIIPENVSLENLVENFRKKCLALNVKNTSTAGIFLISFEKFEKIWETIISEIDEEDDLIKILKKNWITLIKQKRIVAIEETNIKNLVDFI